jgi:inorganic pyrophosphatase
LRQKAAKMGGAMSQRLLCVIEIPKGSRNKYELDHETGAIKLDRLLFSSVHYPTDYGFIPDTWALDDDPLDAMVCVSEPTFPGCQIEVKPIALLRMRDEKGIDDKVLCVPRTDPGWNSLEVLEDIPQGLRDEIGHVFSIYKNLERKQVDVDGWYSREDALAEIEASRTRFKERQKEHGWVGSAVARSGALEVRPFDDPCVVARDVAGPVSVRPVTQGSGFSAALRRFRESARLSEYSGIPRNPREELPWPRSHIPEQEHGARRLKQQRWAHSCYSHKGGAPEDRRQAAAEPASPARGAKTSVSTKLRKVLERSEG